MLRRPRYRVRTWLRERLPEPLSRLFPPGPRNCGSHEWFRADEETDRCWHCLVGERPHRPVPIDRDSEVWQGLREAAESGDRVSRRALLRMMAEHEAYETAVVSDMKETAARLEVDTEILGRQKIDAEKAFRSFAAAAE